MRYVTIHDLRGTRTWAHAPSTRLYIHMCMTCDWQTGAWHGTRRKTCLEIGISDQEWKTALANMQRDGLVKIPTQESTQQATQRATQRATQVTIMIYNNLGGGTPPKEQPNNPPKEQPNEPPSINKNNKSKKYSLSHARAKLPQFRDAVAAYCSLSDQEAAAAVRAFCIAQQKKGKTWNDEEDFRLHLCDWSLKNYVGVKTVTGAENKAEERRQRTEAIENAPSKEEQEEQELRRKLEYLEYLPKMPNLAGIVKGWHEQGAWYDDRLRAATLELFDRQPELRDKLVEILGIDLLQVSITN